VTRALEPTLVTRLLEELEVYGRTSLILLATAAIVRALAAWAVHIISLGHGSSL
jgi:hypothetical protein